MDSAIKFEAARLHFLSDVFVARRRRCSLSFLTLRRVEKTSSSYSYSS